MPKLYRVRLEFEGYALASSESAAIELYKESGTVDLAGDAPVFESAIEVTGDESLLDDWVDCLPWSDGSGPERTVGQIVAALREKEATED